MTAAPARGLARFVGGPARQAAERLARQEATGRVCELCGAPMPDAHGHVVDLQVRRLVCTCRPCALLFVRPQAGGGRFRGVPDRVLRDATGGPATADWDCLQIPVAVAFFLRDGATGAVSAFYPSPAGATECLLDLAAWDRIRARCPVIDLAEPDVEGVLARRDRDGVECFVVPIDACYELVGLLRRTWKGFDGGQQARAGLADFFGRLRERSTPVPGSSGEQAGSGVAGG